jgi:transcriptional regulator with XRE-family HTH domain
MLSYEIAGTFRGMEKPVPEEEDIPESLRADIAANLMTHMARAPKELQSDEGLGEKAGVSYKTVQRLRLAKSRPNLGSLCRIADALGIPVWQLLYQQVGRKPLISGVASQQLPVLKERISFTIQTQKRRRKKTV